MLVNFQKVNGGTIAINPKFVMFVEESPVGVDIVMSDGGTSKVHGNFLQVVGIIQGQLQ